jgi:hypothetical protein
MLTQTSDIIGIGGDMYATLWPSRIDILSAGSFPKESWESLLNELKAEHVASATPIGKRMAATLRQDGQTDVFIYRTSVIPDEEVVRILAKYGIQASVGDEKASA